MPAILTGRRLSFKRCLWARNVRFRRVPACTRIKPHEANNDARLTLFAIWQSAVWRDLSPPSSPRRYWPPSASRRAAPGAPGTVGAEARDCTSRHARCGAERNRRPRRGESPVVWSSPLAKVAASKLDTLLLRTGSGFAVFQLTNPRLAAGPFFVVVQPACLWRAGRLRWAAHRH